MVSNQTFNFFSDAVRKDKVKNILGTLANQAGELNKMDRKNKNSKRKK